MNDNTIMNRNMLLMQLLEEEGFEFEETQSETIQQRESDENIPLSFSQQRLWVLHQIEPGKVFYNMVGAYKLTGSLDLVALRETLDTIIQRHQILRTSFKHTEKGPVQIIHSDMKIDLVMYDMSHQDEEESETYIKQFVYDEFRSPFDIVNGPLYKHYLINLSDSIHVFVVSMHHIISDGWSVGLFFKEITELYNAKLTHRSPHLEPLSIQYADYSIWQRQYFKSSKMQEHLDYWLEKLSGITTLKLSLDFPRPNIQKFHGKHLLCEISLPLTEKLNLLCRKEETTLFMVLLSAFKLLLYRYSGQSDIAVGSPIANRTVSKTEKLIGFFVNSLVLRTIFDPNDNFLELLQNVKMTTLDAYEHQEMPFEKLVSELKKDRDLSMNPLFQVMFVLQNTPANSLKLEGLEIDSYFIDDEISRFDLTLSLEEVNGIVKGWWEYNCNLFKQETIAGLNRHFLTLLEKVAENPALKVNQVSFLKPDELETILQDFNQTAVDFDDSKTVIQLFEEQATANSRKKAIVYNNSELTYGELNENASNLGKYILNNGFPQKGIAGLLAERSEKIVTGMMGILKSGGTFLPIDYNNPRERIKNILDNSNADLLLATKKALKNLPFTMISEKDEKIPPCVITNRRQQIKDFDSLPIPDRSYISYSKYSQYIGLTMFKNVMSIQGSRGCPYHCAYCHKLWPKTNVVRSAQNIFDEIMLYYKMGIKRFAILDDIFNLNIKNGSDLYQLILKNKLDVQLFFPNGLRGDILTGEYIDLMVEAGTRLIALSLETAVPRLQKLIGKNLKIDRFRKNISYVVDKFPDIILELNFMLGFPTETKDEAMETINFVKSVKWIHFPYLHILKIYQDTSMYNLAVANGVSIENIRESLNLAYHELPETLPYDKKFIREIQSDLMANYILSSDRLKAVLKYQTALLTKEELIQKYDSYLPFPIKKIDDICQKANIPTHEIDLKSVPIKKYNFPGDIDKALQKAFHKKNAKENAFHILLLDLSQYFSSEANAMLYDIVENIVEPPLGLMYLAASLKKAFDDNVRIKIAKSRIDFDDYSELKKLIEEYQPDLIGIRTLSFYKDFFHSSIALIRQWGFQKIMIAGGPYPSSSYKSILKDKNIDLVTMGEGEKTVVELVGKILENDNQIPDPSVLKTIDGIAFLKQKDIPGLPGINRQIVFLDEDISFTTIPSALPEVTPADTAYVIYTSGSTGIPKGVKISHKALLNLCNWHNLFYNVKPDEKAVQYANIGFDASIWEIFPYLINGNELHIIDDSIKLNIKAINDYFQEQGISIGFLPTQICEEFLKHDNNSLKRLLTGGDKLKQYAPDNVPYDLYNNYGPTENTVVTTVGKVARQGESKELPQYPVIGKPISNSRVYILDNYLNVVPIGVPGELFIAGDSLAEGYLNNENLSEEKFSTLKIENHQERVYRTGDLVRWQSDGTIEFLGRIDTQVKMRGLRMELGEIEAQLLNFKPITNTVVVVREGDSTNKHLCAYFTADYEIEESELKKHLIRKLPDYMIPSYFIQLDTIPLTPNGKIDHKRLVSRLTKKVDAQYTAPRNEIEKKLALAWQSVLNVENVSITENFFDLGGDSIKAILLVSKAAEYRLKFEVADLLRFPTIVDLVDNVQIEISTSSQPSVEGSIPFNPIQKWFLEQDLRDQHHWNQTFMLQSKQPLNISLLEKVFYKILEHHDTLRLVLDREKTSMQYFSLEELDFSIKVTDFYHTDSVEEKIKSEATAIQGSINLYKGPLLKVHIFQTDNGDCLLIAVHHLIIDGVSWRILLEDLFNGYLHALAGNEVQFPSKSHSFGDWTKKLSEYSSSNQIKEDFPYWKSICQSDKDLLKHQDYIKKRGTFSEIAHYPIQMSEKDTQLLLKEANKAYNTGINDILIAALGLAIKNWSEKQRCVINLEGHGREELFENIDISRTIGWFTTAYPFLIKLDQDNDLGAYIMDIKESIREVPMNGLSYGILRYLSDIDETDKEKLAVVPQIWFNYLGQFDSTFSGGDLSLSEYSAGDSIAANSEIISAIAFNGSIIDSKLGFMCSYDSTRYSEDTIKILADSFKQQLIKIITHCVDNKESHKTPSDFSAELSFNELNNILKELDI